MWSIVSLQLRRRYQLSQLRNQNQKHLQYGPRQTLLPCHNHRTLEGESYFLCFNGLHIFCPCSCHNGWQTIHFYIVCQASCGHALRFPKETTRLVTSIRTSRLASGRHVMQQLWDVSWVILLGGGPRRRWENCWMLIFMKASPTVNRQWNLLFNKKFDLEP